MSPKTVPISVRLSDDDAAFLARLTIAGAVTPSEKLRAILAEARRRHEGREDYASCVAVFEDMLAPALQRLREIEYKEHLHSEFVAKLYAWMPPVAALLLIGAHNGSADSTDAGTLEAGLADHVFTLMESVLRLGLTAQSPCFDTGLIADRLDRVLELTDLIADKHNRPKGNTQ